MISGEGSVLAPIDAEPGNLSKGSGAVSKETSDNIW